MNRLVVVTNVTLGCGMSYTPDVAGFEVEVLGQPTCAVAGMPLRLSGRTRILAVRLALAGGHGVTAAALRVDLWPGSEGSDGAVRVALTRLRHALGDSSVVRVGPSYRLDDVKLDSVEFERVHLAARDRSASIERRLALYDDALSMWKGAAFEGLEDLEWIRAEARRLDVLRDQAIDERFDLMLAVGDHEQVVADLTRAHELDPMLERRAGLLALALYRCGRQADALRVISTTRRMLRDELGVSIGDPLADLEVKLLQQSDDVAVPMVARHARAAVEVESRIRAATALIRAGAYDDAGRIIDEAEQVATYAGDRRSGALVLIARARLRMLSGVGDPHPLIDEARNIGRTIRDGVVLARAALVRAGAGVPEDRVATLIELMEPVDLLAPDAPELVELLCFAAVVVSFMDASDAALRLVGEAERIHHRFDTERTRVALLVARCIVGAVRSGPPEETSALSNEAFQLATRLDDPWLIVIASQAALRARYLRGDLKGVDEVVASLSAASSTALLPFGIVRALLCETTNALARGDLVRVPMLIQRSRSEGSRLGTFSFEIATKSQELLLAQEMDLLGEFAPMIRAMAEPAGSPPVWTAILALSGDERAGHDLAALVDDVPHDDLFESFVALSAEVAARRRDAVLGRWCADQLTGSLDLTLMSGLGTSVLGFAAHFAGLAHVAFDDLGAAVVCFEHAVELAAANGAGLWHAHSTVELAHALTLLGVEQRASALLDSVDESPVASESPRVSRRVRECRALASARGPTG